MTTPKFPLEADWKLFRKKLPDWQERFMDRLNHEYKDIIDGPGLPSTKFWALEKRLRNDQRKRGVQAEISRSRLVENMGFLLAEGAISLDDLAEFSDEMIAQAKLWAGIK